MDKIYKVSVGYRQVLAHTVFVIPECSPLKTCEDKLNRESRDSSILDSRSTDCGNDSAGMKT